MREASGVGSCRVPPGAGADPERTRLLVRPARCWDDPGRRRPGLRSAGGVVQTENEAPDVAREGSGGDPDPGTATTAEDLATLLGVLRIRRGEPSLRTLERRSRAPRPDGVPSVALSRTTVSAILNAERFPTHDVLVALLDALGVAPADQE